MARRADDLKFLTDEFESMAFRRRGYERDALLQAVIDRSGFKDLVAANKQQEPTQRLAKLPDEVSGLHTTYPDELDSFNS